MDVNTRNRAELKSYFVKNSIPTESNFAELIDGMLNQKEDGLVKLPGNPLTIEAAGDNNSEKKLFNIYASFGDQNPAWTLNLNPRPNPNDPATARPGFNISDGEGRSRLFIDRSTGNIGLGTIEPATAKLEVNGSFKASANASGQGEILMEAPADGKHRLDPAEADEESYKTGLVYRVKQNPRSEAPIFQVRSSGQAVRLFVDHDGWTGSRHNSAWFEGTRINYFAGSVGIGTSGPVAKLEVAGNIVGSNMSVARINSDRGALFLASAGDFNHALYNNYSNIDGDGQWDGAKWNVFDGLDIRIGSGKAKRSALYINSTGNVGLGTDIPGEKLEVAGVVRATDGLRIDGNRNAHLDNDGALYRYGGQVYITVDDNLYIRDAGGDVKFHFDTNNGIIRQQAWQSPTFQNNWQNYSSQYNSAGYFKDSQGIVHLKGLVKNGAIGKSIFSLPAGYRPAKRELQVVCTNNNTVGRADIETDGSVLATSGNNAWFSLDGITFRAA